MEAPFYPIIYVRGYAMTESERDETAADPFCGFNVGSTVYRASVNKNDAPKRFVFESPVVRLAGDFGYTDVYENGMDITDDDWKSRGDDGGIPGKSIVVHRYYDSGSGLLGDGKARKLDQYARELNDLVLRVRQLVCLREGIKPEKFKCYLVAHSMGGLVARAFLQNETLGSAQARKSIDKFFTYATPHNGIDVAGMNVPGWLGLNEINTFNTGTIAEYLALQDVNARYKRVDFMRETQFPLDRIFCLIGTNRSDYEVAKGLSRTFVGHGSDGLVKIENAGLWGLDKNLNVTGTAATAFAYRSHSGYFGIVNSEEAYQNLWRFLFGDIRVDVWIEVDGVALPKDLESDAANVDGLYQFEVLARPRGKRWYLSRRVAEEDSSACRTHKQLTGAGTVASRKVFLSTIFLANRAKVSTNPNDRTLGYSLDIKVRVPDYEVAKKFWPNQHYEGSYLFRDALIVEMVPPDNDGKQWTVKHIWESEGLDATRRPVEQSALANTNVRLEVALPGGAAKPGMSGRVVLIASPWNPPVTDDAGTPVA